jgi:hypothetical protein
MVPAATTKPFPLGAEFVRIMRGTSTGPGGIAMRLRTSIRGIMAIVLLFAVGVAALREADDVWASLSFSLTLLVLGVVALGAAFRRGRSRAFYAGTAAFGWAYMALCFGPWAADAIRPHLATTELLDYAAPLLAEGSHTDRVLQAASATQPSNAMNLGDFVAYVTSANGKQIVFSTFVATSATEPFLRVGHSLLALLIALVGGLVARHFHATREEAR